ncbi:MAG: PAS domain S-box protein [Pirellulales bacterium]
MPPNRKSTADLIDENRRLRAQIAQLEDRLDLLAEQRAVVKALHQTEALHHDVMSAVSDAVLITDDAGRLTYVSPNAHLIFGHSPEDILKQGRIEYLLPDSLFDQDVLEHRGEVDNVPCQIRDAVGRARNLLVTVRRVDHDRGTLLYACRDVTERLNIELQYANLQLTQERRVEEQTSEVRQSREQYRRLVEALRDEYLFYAADPSGVVTYVSPSIHSILGYTPNQVIGHNWREFVDTNHELYSEVERLQQMRFAGLATPRFCAPVLHANGELRLLEMRDAPVLDADGRVIASEGFAKDITQRLKAEEALRHGHEELEHRVDQRTAELKAAYERLRDGEHRYRSVVEDQLEYIVRWRSDGVRTFVNQAYCRSRNASPEQLIGKSFMPTIVEQDLGALKRKLATVSVDNPVIVSEHRIVMPDGRMVWERWSNRALFDEEGKLIEFQSVGNDVTEHRKQEKHAEERAMAAAQLRALTEREQNVMRLVVAGDANKVIARKLDLSIKTIEKHRSRLMKKLHVRSVPELVRLALLVEESTES